MVGLWSGMQRRRRFGKGTAVSDGSVIMPSMSSERVEEDPVPASIRSAERWRVIGERLRTQHPELYEQFLAVVAMSSMWHNDDSLSDITKVYFTA